MENNVAQKSDAPADMAASHRMRCMEIWGGVSAASRSINAPGMDAYVYAEPHEGGDAGGDVHYLSMCGGGNIARMLLADVSGHGEHVSQIALGLRTLVRKNINRIDSSKMAQDLNAQFSELAEVGKFATAVMTSYFAPTKQMVIVNAGHPRLLWYSAAKRLWRMLSNEDPDHIDTRGPMNLPLGVIGDTGYCQFAVTLQPGDLIVAYTDALIEAKSPDGRLIGEEGLLGLIRTLDTRHPEQLAQSLLARLKDYRGGKPADDDVTLVVMHHNANKPQFSLGERLGAMAKMMGLGTV